MKLLRLLSIGIALGVLQVVLRSKNDDSLVRRLQAREPQAMSELYERFGRLAYSLILRIVRNPSIAEDLVQETFLRVWNRVASFDGDRGTLGPWVLAVARNRAIDHLRSADGHMDANSVEMERLERPNRFTGLDSSALSLDRARRLKSALEKLNANQKLVIELAYYEGMSQTEMAQKLKQPLGTVKTWTRSALTILRSELAEVAVA